MIFCLNITSWKVLCKRAYTNGFWPKDTVFLTVSAFGQNLSACGQEIIVKSVVKC